MANKRPDPPAPEEERREHWRITAEGVQLIDGEDIREAAEKAGGSAKKRP